MYGLGSLTKPNHPSITLLKRNLGRVSALGFRVGGSIGQPMSLEYDLGFRVRVMASKSLPWKRWLQKVTKLVHTTYECTVVTLRMGSKAISTHL